jgi:transposase
MGKRKRRHFTAEFKHDAVQLVRNGGRSLPQIAKDLDLPETALRNWVKQADLDEGRGPATALSTQERDELSQLRRENKQLKMEREILKKAAAFFAKENS